MKKTCKTRCARKGLAMMMVLFVVMAIAIIATGFIARSDAALQCGSNYTHHRQADYLAWSGLEHARAVISSPDNTEPITSWSGEKIQLDAASGGYYDVTIASPVEVVAAADPNDSTYRYTINSSAYYTQSSVVQSRSRLTGDLLYVPSGTDCYYISVTRP